MTFHSVGERGVALGVMMPGVVHGPPDRDGAIGAWERKVPEMTVSVVGGC